MSPAVQRRPQGRRCDGPVVYAAYDSAGLVDGVAMLVLGLPRDGPSGRPLLVFATGSRISVEHDGDRSHLQIIPPAA